MVGRPVADDRAGHAATSSSTPGPRTATSPASPPRAGDAAELMRADDRGLIAVQGPRGRRRCRRDPPRRRPSSVFMTLTARPTSTASEVIVSRSGYTGEDGFEILVPPTRPRALWDRLLQDERARPIGLGARDSLRLEAGPAALRPRPRRDHLAGRGQPRVRAIASAGAKAEDFPGARADAGRARPAGSSRRRVGLRVLEGAPAREGAEIVDADGRRRRQGHQRRLLALARRADRHGLRRPPALAETGARAGRHRARQAPAGRGRRRCRSSPIATIASPLKEPR